MATPEPAAAKANEQPERRPSFEAEAAALLTAEQLKREKAVRWEGRLTSLWSPVSIFGLAFLPYLVVIELATCSYLWLQPLLKGFGLLMLVYFFGLWAVRLGWARYARLRKLRHLSYEQLEEVRKLTDAHRHKLGDKVCRELVTAAADLRQTMLDREPEKLEKALDRLSTLAEKHLSGFRRGAAFDTIGGFAKALVLALLIRAVVIEPFKIPSGSMIPTLEIGDQIFVNKFIYGVRIPWANIVPFQIVRAPQRGDVIVFNNPVEPDKDFIKRVVGVPGDTIELREKVVYVNGVAQPTEVVNADYTFADEQGGQWYVGESTLVKEDLGTGPHLTMRHRGMAYGTEGPYQVPPDQVFVLGDNRDGSMDSRYGLGDRERGVEYVPYNRIKGKAMVIWFAWGYHGLGSGLFGGAGLRTDRLFQPVPYCSEAGVPPPAKP